MIITVEANLGKKENDTFEEFAASAYEMAMQLGRETVRQALEERDEELRKERDRRRYRCKGKQKTSIKTRLGVIEFVRNVYVDNRVREGVKCVHLLDEELGIEKIGYMAKEVCEAVGELVCESSYRAAAKKFHESKEGVIASRYDVKAVELRIINGDGANWIQKRGNKTCICVLDKFHRNKKLTECIRNKDFFQTAQTLLYDNRIEDLLACIEAQMNSTEDKTEQDGLRELLTYYTENKNGGRAKFGVNDKQCQRQSEIVRKRRRNFVVFRRGG